jgi:hypothetical protein
VQVLLDNPIGHIKRALAVTATRSEALPDIPTLVEFVPGYDASGWFGVGAPKGTPPEIIDKLNTEISAGLADPNIKARLPIWAAWCLRGRPPTSASTFRPPTSASTLPQRPRIGPRLTCPVDSVGGVAGAFATTVATPALRGARAYAHVTAQPTASRRFMPDTSKKRLHEEPLFPV